MTPEQDSGSSVPRLAWTAIDISTHEAVCGRFNLAVVQWAGRYQWHVHMERVRVYIASGRAKSADEAKLDAEDALTRFLLEHLRPLEPVRLTELARKLLESTGGAQ